MEVRPLLRSFVDNVFQARIVVGDAAAGTAGSTVVIGRWVRLSIDRKSSQLRSKRKFSWWFFFIFFPLLLCTLLVQKFLETGVYCLSRPNFEIFVHFNFILFFDVSQQFESFQSFFHYKLLIKGRLRLIFCLLFWLRKNDFFFNFFFLLIWRVRPVVNFNRSFWPVLFFIRRGRICGWGIFFINARWGWWCGAALLLRSWHVDNSRQPFLKLNASLTKHLLPIWSQLVPVTFIENVGEE